MLSAVELPFDIEGVWGAGARRGTLTCLRWRAAERRPQGSRGTRRATGRSGCVLAPGREEVVGGGGGRRAVTGLKWRAAGSATSRECWPAPGGSPARVMPLPARPGRAGGRRAGLARGRGPRLARDGRRPETPLLASRGPPRAPARFALITWEISFNSTLLGRRAPPRKSPS